MSGEATYDVIVVGGGIAGLAAGWALRDRSLLVLEADARAGGRILSAPRGEHWLNFGAHVFPGAATPTGRLVREAGLETVRIRGSVMGLAVGGRVVSGGPAETYPLRLPLPLAARASLVKAGLKVRRAVAAMTRERHAAGAESAQAARLRGLRQLGDETFADFLGPLHPDVAAIFRSVTGRTGGAMDEISAGCGVEHMAQATSGKASSYLDYLPGGAGRFPQALAAGLGDALLTEARATSVAAGEDRVVVAYEHGGASRTATARQVVVATPADVTARIVRTLTPATADALARVPYGPFLSVALLTSEDRAMPWDGLYAAAVAGKRFNMLFNHASILRADAAAGWAAYAPRFVRVRASPPPPPPRPRRVPGGSLMAYASAGFARALIDEPDAAIERAVLEDLHAVYPQTRGIVSEVVVQRWPRGVPFVGPGRHRLQEALEAPQDRVHLAGDYFDYAGMDVSVGTALEAAARIRRELV